MGREFIVGLRGCDGDVVRIERTGAGKTTPRRIFEQIAPSVTRVAVLRDSASARDVGQFAAIQANASSFGVELLPLDAQDGSDIDRAIGAFAGRAGGGLLSLRARLR
jgi:hypothetical protein